MNVAARMKDAVAGKRVALARARRRGGLGAVVRLLATSVADHALSPVARLRHDRFDVRHGVDTRGRVTLGNLSHGSARYHDGAIYSPAHYPRLSRVLGAMARRANGGFMFVDLGCGKGLPLLLAAQRGFRPVIGVELDPRLVQIAQRNARAFAANSGVGVDAIEVVDQDAARYEFQPLPTVLFLYNPFGVQTLQAVLDNIVNSVTRAPRPFFIVYYNPVYREVLDACQALRPERLAARWALYSVRIGE